MLRPAPGPPADPGPPARSEEHTSELQSQSNLVCRLLLEKKKTSISEIISNITPPPTFTRRSVIRFHLDTDLVYTVESYSLPHPSIPYSSCANASIIYTPA